MHFTRSALTCLENSSVHFTFFFWSRPNFTGTRWFIMSCLAKDLFTPTVTEIVRNALCQNLFPPQFLDNWNTTTRKYAQSNALFLLFQQCVIVIVPCQEHRLRAITTFTSFTHSSWNPKTVLFFCCSLRFIMQSDKKSNKQVNRKTLVTHETIIFQNVRLC